MNVEEERRWSAALGQEMAFKIYGHAGRPVIAFPSLNGRYWDFEGFGMIEACAALIDDGRVQIVAADGIDWQSWENREAHPADRARRHQDYDRYVVEELAPAVRRRTGWPTAWATGASMGAFHAANVLFRHPDAFDGLVAMSGVYQLRQWVGEYMDDAVYFNTPLAYLPGLEDPWYLGRLRRARIAFVVGQGAWEEPMVEDARAMEAVLAAKRIPAIVDYWGHDVDHDWPWWRRMLPYELERLDV
jgi:esterase/lipase superfamily enzyme